MKYMAARFKNLWLRCRMSRKKMDRAARMNLAALDGISLSSAVRSNRYVVFDLEMTGLDRKRDEIVSIGAFRVNEGRIRLDDVFDRLVNPGMAIPSESVKIHGIVPDMVAGSSPAQDALKEFLAFVDGDILVAHHAGHDIHFINRLMRRAYGFAIQNLVLDTMLLCRRIALPPHAYPFGIDLNDVEYSLDGIARLYGIEIHQRHTALGDALATAMIFQRIIAECEKAGKDSLGRLVREAAIFG